MIGKLDTEKYKKSKRKLKMNISEIEKQIRDINDRLKTLLTQKEYDNFKMMEAKFPGQEKDLIDLRKWLMKLEEKVDKDVNNLQLTKADRAQLSELEKKFDTLNRQIDDIMNALVALNKQLELKGVDVPKVVPTSGVDSDEVKKLRAEVDQLRKQLQDLEKQLMYKLEGMGRGGPGGISTGEVERIVRQITNPQFEDIYKKLEELMKLKPKLKKLQ